VESISTYPFTAGIAMVCVIPYLITTIRAIPHLIFRESFNIFLAWSFVKWQKLLILGRATFKEHLKALIGAIDVVAVKVIRQRDSSVETW
jgi:hypothetical protein